MNIKAKYIFIKKIIFIVGHQLINKANKESTLPICMSVSQASLQASFSLFPQKPDKKQNQTTNQSNNNNKKKTI